MSVAVELSDEVVSHARREGAANGRSVAEQIEFEIKVLRNAVANPDLSVAFVRDILEGLEGVEKGDVAPFEFEDLK